MQTGTAIRKLLGVALAVLLVGTLLAPPVGALTYNTTMISNPNDGLDSYAPPG
jgi:hypothetical protein